MITFFSRTDRSARTDHGQARDSISVGAVAYLAESNERLVDARELAVLCSH